MRLDTDHPKQNHSSHGENQCVCADGKGVRETARSRSKSSLTRPASLEMLKSDHFTFGPLVDERYGDFAPTIMAFDLAFGYDCARCISTKAARTAVSDGSRRWGQVSLSSLLEFYACSEVFRSSRIGLDSQCFLGASSQEELCSSSLRWFLRHGSLGRRSYRLEKESWIDTHDECYGDFAPTIGIPAPRDFDIPCKT